jgi:hypothetical protein
MVFKDLSFYKIYIYRHRNPSSFTLKINKVNEETFSSREGGALAGTTTGGLCWLIVLDEKRSKISMYDLRPEKNECIRGVLKTGFLIKNCDFSTVLFRIENRARADG